MHVEMLLVIYSRSGSVRIAPPPNDDEDVPAID
jgi:hypothetical protein